MKSSKQDKHLEVHISSKYQGRASQCVTHAVFPPQDVGWLSCAKRTVGLELSIWLHPVSFSRGKRGGGSSMTQDSLKPQCGTCPSSPPLAFSSLCQLEEKESPVLTSFSFPKVCSCFPMPRLGSCEGPPVVRNSPLWLSPPPLCSKSCEIRRHCALPHPETTLHHFCRRDSSFAMALQNRRELSREFGGHRRRPHQKYLPATETLLLPSVPNGVCKNV